jgi:UDP-N-acetylglucosamine:LPS N-acetylglucosamine transferase
MSILLACSAGGHLAEMKQLHPFYRQMNYFFVTFDRPDTRELSLIEKVYFIERPARNPFKTIHSFFQAWNIVSAEKPKIVISTGADVTVPVCIAAKLQGVPIIFIESFCRVTEPGMAGRIVSLFADRVFYQWKELKSYYPSGVFTGSIFGSEHS